jgi:hypothetical protein
MGLCEIHRKLVHIYKYDEGAYRICDMTLSHVARWRRSRQGFGQRTGCKCEGQVGGFGTTHHTWRRSLRNDLATMDKGNGEERARLRSMNQMSRNDIKVDHFIYCWRLVLVWHQHWRKDGTECARQSCIYRAFNFTGLRLSREEKTGFKIDRCTVKRNLLVPTVIQCH